MPKASKKKLADMEVMAILTAFFFVLTFAIKAFVDGPFGRGEISSTIAYTKYVTAAIACLTGFAHSLGSGEKVFVKEFNLLFIVVFVFALLSVAMQFISGIFSSVVYVELIKLAMPIILAYIVLNALDEDTIYKCMVAILVVSLIGYAFDLQAEGVTFSSFLQADFSSSSSETESSLFSGTALVLALYFMYFRKSNLALIISVVFSILTFKRLAILVTLIALFITIFLPKLMKMSIPRGFITFCKVATLAVTLLYFWILLPEQQSLFFKLMGQTQSDFTMGRSMVMDYLMSIDFQSYGFGSANETAIARFGAPFEMDLIKIAFELTPIATVVFVWLFWDVAGSSFWGMFIVAYYIVNMITSDSLTSNFAFTLAYMTLGLVNYSADARVSSVLNSRARKKKAINSGGKEVVGHATMLQQ